MVTFCTAEVYLRYNAGCPLWCLPNRDPPIYAAISDLGSVHATGSAGIVGWCTRPLNTGVSTAAPRYVYIIPDTSTKRTFGPTDTYA